MPKSFIGAYTMLKAVKKIVHQNLNAQVGRANDEK
ncbi:MAG: hypothetical protein [Bacteriophage sp.]|nr:MAG: hypothetical protein [Bacteriophage sp.]